MADEKNADAEVLSVIQSMYKNGASDDEVAKFIQRHDDKEHPFKARVAGAIEGLAPGIIGGLMALPKMALDTVSDTIDVLQGKSPENAKKFLDGLVNTWPSIRDAEPREQAKMISELVTSFGVGAATTGTGLRFNKPIARTVGEGLEYLGSRKNAVPIAMGSGLAYGLMTGNPMRVAEGAAAGLLPPLMEKVGTRLVKYGGGVPRAIKEATPRLQEQFDQAMAKRNVAFADEQAAAEGTMRKELESETKVVDKEQQAAAKAQKKADENARNLAEIRKGREGQTAGEPTFSRSVSAESPEGGRESMSIRFNKPGDGEQGSPYTPQEQELLKRAKQVSDPPQPGETVSMALKRQAPKEPPATVSDRTTRPPITVQEPPMATSTTIPATPASEKIPRNLQMGSTAPVSDMMQDVRSRVQGGGVKVPGAGPTRQLQLKTGTKPLSLDAQMALDQFMKENPNADRALVEQTIRKLAGE